MSAHKYELMFIADPELGKLLRKMERVFPRSRGFR